MKKLLFLIPVIAIASCQPESGKSSVADTEKEPTPETPSEVAIDVSQPQSLVGRELAKVQAACDEAEIPHRVIEIDGEGLPATMDYRPERLSFAVTDGIIVKVTTG
jgi:hypothetical protein